MNKDVLISIKGLQYALEDSDDQRIETINRGSLAMMNDKYIVTYEEILEGLTSPTKNLIRFNNSIVEVTKKGELSVHLVFEVGQKNVTNYNTPFGSLSIGIDTHNIIIEEKESEITVRVEYDMDINYEHVASCKIDIVIKEV
ncbi:MAG: DUF1934 domain-containing protein [Lachnospiraceae bacterium]|nr:DUF1934 domain-containing protein [Lachnospiraceae bacterium]